VNKLSSNISKTHHVLFKKKKNVKSDTHVLKLDNTIINRVKCIRTVLKSDYNAPTEPLFKTLQILKLKDMCTFQLSKIMYSFIIISLSDPLMTMFTVNRYIHSHETRHLHQPHIQYRKTVFLSKRFIYLAPETWYKLPETIGQLRSQHSFNISVKKFLTNSNYQRHYELHILYNILYYITRYIMLCYRPNQRTWTADIDG